MSQFDDNKNGLVDSLCISENKGERKYPLEKVFFEKNIGIISDSHGDGGFRQVSFLSRRRIENFNNEVKVKIEDGIFGENVITSELDLSGYPLRTEFLIGDKASIVLIQHGKTCHNKLCPIGVETGNCIMPEVGTFAKVLTSGGVKVGDIIKKGRVKIFCLGFITVSDKASEGTRKDKTYKALIENLKDTDFEVIDHKIIPDERDQIENTILNMTNFQRVDLVITSGGTGLPRRPQVSALRASAGWG